VAYSPDGRTALTGGEDGTARLWDAATGQPIGEPLEHHSPVYTVAFSPDGQSALTGSNDGVARLWDAATGQPIGRPLEHRGAVVSLAFSRDGKSALTGSNDGVARLWDAATGQSIGRPIEHRGAVRGVAYSPDGKTLLTGSWDGAARLWDAATGRPLGEPLRHQGRVLSVAFGPGGKGVLTGSDDGMARLWDVSTGRPLGRPLRHQGEVLAVAFDPGGKAILTGNGDGTARLWNVATAQPIGSPLSHQGPVHAVAFSPDGKTLLTGSWDGAAQLWDAATGQPIRGAFRHKGPVFAVAFSPDGRTILTGSEDQSARLWDAATGRPLGRPLRHHGHVLALAYSPDGRTILTGSADRTARLWDAATGQPLGKSLHHQGVVCAVAYSPDAKTILTGSWDGTARLWDAPAPLPDDLPRLSARVETLTGLELDEQGVIRVLDTTQWTARRQRLSELGGPPDTGRGHWLDPILFGPEPTVRARSLIELGRWGDAEAAFAEVVDARPDVASVWLERGRYYLTRSQPAKAAADFARALDLVPEDCRWASPHNSMILDLARSERAYATLLELRPDDGHLWTGRGRYHALRSQWDRAAADFARGIGSAPPESEEWFEHACLRLIVGDAEGYRKFVQEMQRREGQTDDPLVAGILARSANLAADPTVAPEQAVRWAEQAVASDRNAWYLHALGAAHYRAGHLDEAIARLEESNAGTWPEEGKAQNRLILAMAYQRLGNVTKACAELDEVMRWWKGLEAAKTDEAVSMPTTDWLALQVLRREAEAVILLDPIFPPDPFVQ
jgi:WD40 repeat protein/tetratricopeptide (TPR) repeat protein